MHAELVRVALHEVDIKIVSGARMHVLQWRRNLLWDEVLLDGKRQASSHGLFNRERCTGWCSAVTLTGAEATSSC